MAKVKSLFTPWSRSSSASSSTELLLLEPPQMISGDRDHHETSSSSVIVLKPTVTVQPATQSGQTSDGMGLSDGYETSKHAKTTISGHNSGDVDSENDSKWTMKERKEPMTGNSDNERVTDISSLEESNNREYDKDIIHHKNKNRGHDLKNMN